MLPGRSSFGDNLTIAESTDKCPGILARRPLKGQHSFSDLSVVTTNSECVAKRWCRKIEDPNFSDCLAALAEILGLHGGKILSVFHTGEHRSTSAFGLSAISYGCFVNNRRGPSVRVQDHGRTSSRRELDRTVRLRVVGFPALPNVCVLCGSPMTEALISRSIIRTLRFAPSRKGRRLR